MKKLFILFTAATLLASCSSSTNETPNSVDTLSVEVSSTVDTATSTTDTVVTK